MIINGAEIILKVLEEKGVEQIFGLPGGAMLPLYDQLTFSKLKHHLVRHEQGAVHMAEGYARSSGKLGVVFVTSGPGATNTVTGLADAKLDSVPLLVISAQVTQSLIGTDGFQEADIVGITLSATKHNDLIRNIHELEEALIKAIDLALSGRQGPVLLDIPKDVMLAKTEYPRIPKVKFTLPKKPIQGNIDDAARALCEAKKPVCYCGGGIISANASDELNRIVKLLNLPVTPTLMGLGAISGTDPNNLGMLGMHGTYASNMAVHESDCLFAVGVRFDDRVTNKLDEFAKFAKVIHIDIDPSEINKIRNADWPIVGDAKEVLVKFHDAIIRYQQEFPENRPEHLNPWGDAIRSWQKKHPLHYKKDKHIIKPQDVITEVFEQTKGNVITVTDVGQHQMWVAQFFPILRPRTFLSSGGLGTMGFGLPAAIGAKFACPGEVVIAFLGDGSFQMNPQELSSLMNNQHPIKIIIFNNHSLGMVKQWQELFYDSRFSATNLENNCPDFVKLADAYGIKSTRINEISKLSAGITEMLNYNGSYLLDVIVDEKEHVYPMVPAGCSSKDMLLLLKD
ncbi:MAG: biosynthetic-type acetolactate synthase large subunit [Candidatus Margulisiibacteriota bacterium]|jgi:acetolactate synthase-1/2/3 large subunit